MDLREIHRRLAYHAPDEAARELHDAVRTLIWHVYANFDADLPEGREKALAFTKLEEAMFWANAAIARNGGPK